MNQTVNDELAELKARYERLNLLYQVSNVIHSTLDPQEALQLIVSEAVRLMRASSGSVVLINPTNGFLEIHAAQGPAGQRGASSSCGSAKASPAGSRARANPRAWAT